MAAEAGELAAMTDGARFAFLNGPLFRVPVEKVRCVTRRLEVGFLIVAFHARKRRVDLIVANKAIGHSRKCYHRNFVGVFEPA